MVTSSGYALQATRLHLLLIRYPLMIAHFMISSLWLHRWFHSHFIVLISFHLTSSDVTISDFIDFIAFCISYDFAWCFSPYFSDEFGTSDWVDERTDKASASTLWRVLICDLWSSDKALDPSSCLLWFWRHWECVGFVTFELISIRRLVR